MEQRLQKIISDYGIASRRSAEKLLQEGRVTVNSEKAFIGDKADPKRDVIEVDGKSLTARPRKVYIMLNKPSGYVTTMSDEKGRKKVTDLIGGIEENVYPVGRLDMYSEGLLLLTNDGELANKLMHPSYGVKKTYRVWVHGGNLKEKAAALRGEIILDGKRINPAEVIFTENKGDCGVLDITISQGINRQIRKMCTFEELKVERLQRISESGLELGNLQRGRWRFLTNDEINHLKGM